MFFSKYFTTNRAARDEQNELNSIIKGYPLTNTPVVPDILKHQVEFKTLEEACGVPILGFTLAHEGSDLVEPKSLEVIRKRLLDWFKDDYPTLKEHFATALPSNLIAISFSHLGFITGESSQEFKLATHLKAPDNACFTYRKLSECVQCTYFNVDGVEYLAGMCFYPAPHDAPMLLESSDALLYISNAGAIRYPPCDRNKSFLMENHKMYGRFCATAGRHVLLKLSETDGIPRDVKFDHVTKEWKFVLCKECLQDYFTYKWVEPKKDIVRVTPATIQVAPPASATEKASPAAAQDDEATVAKEASTSGSSAVTRADSTESLLEGFDMIVKSSGDDDDSDIDAELIN